MSRHDVPVSGFGDVVVWPDPGDHPTELEVSVLFDKLVRVPAADPGTWRIDLWPDEALRLAEALIASVRESYQCG